MTQRKETRADRLGAAAKLGTPGRLSPGMARALDGWLGRFVRRWYRPSITGLEHVPRDRPSLLVANHSGGGFVDVLTLSLLWRGEFGDSRPATGLTHPAAFHVPLLGDLLRSLGAVPSTYEAALRSFEQGLPVLVFPGGDHEAYRPIWEARKVDFTGRKGFLKIARDAGVPIVPVGIAGTHVTFPILFRSKLIAWLLVFPRLLGVKRLPIAATALLGAIAVFFLAWSRFGTGLSVALAALWFMSPIHSFPLFPSRVKIQVGRPIEPSELFGTKGDLDAPYERVIGAVRELTGYR